jgi:hypothetical protein
VGAVVARTGPPSAFAVAATLLQRDGVAQWRRLRSSKKLKAIKTRGFILVSKKATWAQHGQGSTRPCGSSMRNWATMILSTPLPVEGRTLSSNSNLREKVALVFVDVS